MAVIVESKKFSLFNADGRNNKFWNIALYDNGDVEVQYGPQGLSGQRKLHAGVGRSYFDKKIKEKTKASHEGGAYVENKVLEAVHSTGPVQVVAKHHLAEKAVKDIGADQPELKSLITYFADVNAHNLYEASGGKITYDTSSGQFKTTQGVITLDQIQQARQLLDNIELLASKSDFTSTAFKAVINPYLSLIPQKGLVRQMHFPSMFSTNGGLQQQSDILDGLESSYATVIANAQKDNGSKKKGEEETAIFKVKLSVADAKTFDTVRKYYRETKGFHSDVQSYDVRRVFDLDIVHMSEGFVKKTTEMAKNKPHGANVMRLFHGTKACNMLSILKAGFVMPRKGSSIHITAWLYGPGVYFSDQSTKSIRYATGAWSGGMGAKDRKFMFLADVAMGRMYTPTGGITKLPTGYDSCFAKAGHSGVQNNEMIVYYLSQIKPVIIMECTPYGR
jgi:poly [ADP-ribose] polymerase 2/3/4